MVTRLIVVIISVYTNIKSYTYNIICQLYHTKNKYILHFKKLSMNYHLIQQFPPSSMPRRIESREPNKCLYSSAHSSSFTDKSKQPTCPSGSGWCKNVIYTCNDILFSLKNEWLFLFSFWPLCMAWRTSPTRDQTCAPLQWKHEVLTTTLPRKSKRNEIVIRVTTWMNLENVMSEISQLKGQILCDAADMRYPE